MSDPRRQAPKRRRQFKVTVDMPEGCTEREMVAWLDEAVRLHAWTKGDPHSPLDRGTVWVRSTTKIPDGVI